MVYRFMDKRLMMVFVLVGSVIDAWGQGYDTIPVGITTSVNLIFETPVRKWDMGLGVKIEKGEKVWDILVANPGDSPERIKLAAGIEDFETTNLFVETEDGYYNFILTYRNNPDTLLYKLTPEEASIRKELPIEKKPDENPKSSFTDNLATICKKIENMNESNLGIGEVSQKMLFYLGGIHVSADYLFFQVFVKNEGSLTFDLDFVGFFIGDRTKKGNKKKPRQEETLVPLYVYNEDLSTIKTSELVTRIYVFEKFTLPGNDKLYIQFWEGSGGRRKVELVVKNKDILLAEKI